MSLSASDVNYIRSMLPHSASGQPEYVTEDQLNYLYVNKAGSDLDKTIAYALRQMCIKLSHLVGRTNRETGDTAQQQQEREAVCAQAEQWATMTGVLGGAATTGSISLGIDEEDSQVTNP